MTTNTNKENRRTIKFRFFDGEKMCPVGELTFFADNAGYHINGEFPSTGKDPYPLMQFTGLHDKHVIEIYEGDVIEFEEPRFESVMLRCAVTFYEGSFRAVETVRGGPKYYLLGEAEDMEVVGNIYENPELLTDSSTL